MKQLLLLLLCCSPLVNAQDLLPLRARAEVIDALQEERFKQPTPKAHGANRFRYVGVDYPRIQRRSSGKNPITGHLAQCPP